MATEVEYVNYKDFVAGLESTENPGVDDVTVVSNETDGPRAVPANTSALSNTATDSDLTAAASIELQTVSGKKKAPANLLAKQSGLESANANVAALATYAQNVAHSIAPEFDPTRDSEHAYMAGESVTYTDGKSYTFKVTHYGAWNAADVDETQNGDLICIAKKKLAGVAVVGLRLSTSLSAVKDDDYGLSELISVSAGDIIEINPIVADNNAVAVVYDASLNPLGYFRNALNQSRTIPENGTYIRFSVHVNAFGKFNAIRNDVIIYKSENVVEGLSAVVSDVESTNKFIGKMVVGYCLSADSAFVLNDAYAVSDYVEVTPGSLLYVNFGKDDYDICFVFYNSDKIKINRYRNTPLSRTVEIPASAKYVRFSVCLECVDVFVAKMDDVVIYRPSLMLQNSRLINKIDAVFDDSVNGGDGYLTTTGSVVISYGWFHSDFIEIPVEATTLEWRSGRAEYNATLCLYDSNKNFSAYYRCSHLYEKKTIVAGAYAYARLSFNSNNVLDSMLIADGSVIWKASKFIGMKTKCDEAVNQGAVVRFGCYNTGAFDGADMQSGSSEVAMAMRKALAKAAVNVLATQEDVPYFKSNAQTLSKNECFGMYAYYQRFGDTSTNYKAIASDFKISNFEQIAYDGSVLDVTFSHWYFLKCELDYCGLKIVFISVHLDWADNDRRQEQIRQLVAYSQNYDNVIIAGDFNPENCINGVKQFDPSDFADGGDTHVVDNAIFMAGGFTPCNDGYFGTFGTFINIVNQGYEWPCDNIMVKTNGHLKIKNAGVVVEDYMTDHAIFWADVVLI